MKLLIALLIGLMAMPCWGNNTWDSYREDELHNVFNEWCLIKETVDSKGQRKQRPPIPYNKFEKQKKHRFIDTQYRYWTESCVACPKCGKRLVYDSSVSLDKDKIPWVNAFCRNCYWKGKI